MPSNMNTDGRKRAQVMTVGLHDFEITGDTLDVWVVITMTGTDLALVRAALQLVTEHTGDKDTAALLVDLERMHHA